MKKNGYFKGFVSGLVMTALLVSLCLTVSAATNRTIDVEDGIKITLNGSALTPRDAAGKTVPVFLYEGTTYVPARAISEALGLNVSFDSATRTVVLTSKTSGTAASGTSSGTTASGYITADRAKEIALADAGVKASAVVFIRAELDRDDGRMVYDVEFYSGSKEYDYEIDAASGDILSWDYDAEYYTGQAAGQTGSYLSEAEVRQIVEDRAGVSGTFRELHLDRDDGRVVYEGEMRDGWTEYEFTLDAVTGTILEWDVDRH